MKEYFKNWWEFLTQNPLGAWADFYETYYGFPSEIYWTIVGIFIVVVSTAAGILIYKMNKKK